MGRLATGVRGIKLALTNDLSDDESAVEIEQVKPQPKTKAKSNWLNGGGSKKSGWL